MRFFRVPETGRLTFTEPTGRTLFHTECGRGELGAFGFFRVIGPGRWAAIRLRSSHMRCLRILFGTANTRSTRNVKASYSEECFAICKILYFRRSLRLKDSITAPR